MTLGTIGKSTYSKLVTTLINRICDTTAVADSMYEQAVQYFQQAVAQQAEKIELEQQVFLFENRQKQVSKRDLALVERNLLQAQNERQTFQQARNDEASARLTTLKKICLDILELCQGESQEDTNMNSAKLLGTIQLLSPTEGKHVAASNQKSKHLYKAILSLRLLDKLLADGELNNAYVQQRYMASKGKKNGKDEYDPFRDDVQIPLLMAALLQDIGNCHPEALLILKGADGKADEFRVLENDERLALLQISYRESLKYVTQGLGLDKYSGNSREERDQFIKLEGERQNFVLMLLKNAIKPEHGIGNVLKIPQIYTSVVLSTKSSFAYETLPKVALVLEKGVEKGVYSKVAVDALLSITGIFPQGFGITYIPKDSDRQDLDRYEYAIVTGLYPADIRQPVCRMVTRNLTYNVSAQGCIVSVENNLYYPQARKKLERISEERLLEILSKLVSNFEERKNMPLLPKFWRPDEYFSYVKNQNLWNKVVMHSN
ncbi:hypothetical protein M2404_003458 [Rheinheimera pacifica]|uniref:hypothetical protein n=1 Tax=Rheinheimera pacifica TaxID=173990 RepID=UPI002166E621|nr:hypothetical protein [Rheinheimera pacifica]MCS4309095.1 hypothetical protein [Rheinheimera pacifica]